MSLTCFFFATEDIYSVSFLGRLFLEVTYGAKTFGARGHRLD